MPRSGVEGLDTHQGGQVDASESHRGKGETPNAEPSSVLKGPPSPADLWETTRPSSV